jgi:predicted Zn-dependent protease
MLMQSGRRELPGPGGKRVSVAAVLDPLFAELDKPERRNLAVMAVSHLTNYSFGQEALARARELLARRDIDDISRAALQSAEIVALQQAGKAEEAIERLTALLAAAEDEAAAQNPAWQIWQQHLARGEFAEAAKLRAEFARRFPDSELPRTMDQNLLTQLRSSGRREEAGELAARLAKEEPGSVVWVRTHVNFLASAGKFREAAGALRECLRLNPELRAAPAAGGGEPSEADRVRLVEEAQKEVARLYERHGLVALLARVSAQDAELRADFVKEADAAAKSEDREIRSWTEGALLCLSEAAETEALTARIEKLAAAEPDEPKWPERLARTHLSAGESAKAATAYGRLLVLRPDRADVMVLLAEIALRTKDAKAAEAWRSRALDVLARTPYSLYNQAYAWGQSGRTEWALEAWKRLAARGPYAGSGEAAWQAAALARALNRPKEEAALLMQAALAPGRSYAQNAIGRLGEMIGEPSAGPAARPVAVELLTEWMARAGKAPQVPGYEAYFAAELAQRLERLDDAAALYLRAMEAPDGSYASSAQSQLRGLVQNPRAQKAARPMTEKALAGWLRAPEKLCGQSAWAAAELAQFLERRDDAIRLAARMVGAGQGSAFGTAQFMVNLADSPARRSAAEAALREAVAVKPAWEAAIWTDMLEFLLAEKRGETGAARAALERLAAAPMENPNHAPEVLNALAHAGEKHRDRLVEYALKGGGDLDENWRRNLLQQAVSHCGGSDVRVLRLYRALVELDTGNREDFRRQLIEAMVRLNQLYEAAAELRGLEAGQNAYYVQQEWARVVDAFWSKNDAESQRQAIELALEGWERLSTPEGQGYAQGMFGKLAEFCAQADKQNRLDAPVRRKVLDAVRTATRNWFEAGTGELQYAYNYAHGNRLFEKEGLAKEAEDLARQAAASDDAARVTRAAQYWQGRGMTGEAKQAWRRVLGLAGGDERGALQQLYSLSAHAGPQEWDSALGYLERLQKLGVYAGENYLQERARCLYGLKRADDAREAVGKLLASSSAMLQFQQGNHYWFDSVAGICETAGDWKTAAEAWESSIRVWRWLSAQHPGSYWPNLVQAYQRAAAAYAQAGDGGKSLECYLRGLSVIPREQSGHYQNLLDAALAQLLKGKNLKQVVAEYEKGVDAAGGAEKPHLRIAFAQAYAREGDAAEQLRNLRIAADLLPKDMALRAQVIEGYKALKDEKAVVGAYLAWAKVDQQNLELWRGLGDYYASLGRKDEALTAWATMAEVRPREAEGFRAYARKLVESGRDGPAAAAYRKAVRHRPTSFDVAGELAEVYKRLGQEKAAAELWTAGEKACRQAMEDFADDPTPWLSLGKFLSAQGRKDDARDVYRKILGRSWPRFQSETHAEANQLLNAPG